MEQRLRTIEMVVRSDDETYHEDVPVISGNSLRGQLRDLLARDLLDRLDVEIHDTLSNALYSGGTLERGSGSGKLKRRLRGQVRERIPMLSLLGTALKTQPMDGKLNMGMLVPIARETQRFTGRDSEQSVFEFVDETFYTRMDDRDLPRDEDSDEQAQQMRYKSHVFTPGTRFHHWMSLEHANEIEQACLYHAFDLFSQSPHIGGMKGKGHGKVEFEYNGEGLGSPNPYIEFVETNKEDIREFVLELDEELEG